MLSSYLKRAPFFLRPFIPVYGMIFGILFYVYYLAVRQFCRIDVEGELHPDESRIFAFWHQYVHLFFPAFGHFKGHVWINHPLPYMAPWYFVGRLFGLRKMIPGSTGHDGKNAADALVFELKRGASTGITPDGPAGPPRHLHKGILHIAQQSGIPIVPISFWYKRCLTIPSWDRKILPIPFISAFGLKVGESVGVEADADFARLSQEIGHQLSK